MLKASALYIVIIITLAIGVLCSALIVVAYLYRSVYQQNLRHEQLSINLQSGINILLVDGDAYQTKKKISLFGRDNDSLVLKQSPWGAFDIGIARSFIQRDTLTQVCALARQVDSLKWAALYLIDEDRPLSVSGQTHIRGTAFLPSAGIKEAYVNNQAYTGDKRLIIGTQKHSDKQLPLLSDQRIQTLKGFFTAEYPTDSSLIKNDSAAVSFLQPTKYFNFKKTSTVLSHIRLHGNIILRSDTTITIDSTAQLDQVIIIAQGICVKSGFKGSCQLFAADSIHIGQRCRFEYPSFLGVMPAGENKNGIKQLTVDDHSVIQGTLFIAATGKASLPPVISLGQQVTIAGQVYVQGLVDLKDKVHIYGSVFTNRFTYQSSYTHYENYLINLDIDALKLSPYYLSSDLLPTAGKKRKVLQWLP